MLYITSLNPITIYIIEVVEFTSIKHNPCKFKERRSIKLHILFNNNRDQLT